MKQKKNPFSEKLLLGRCETAQKTKDYGAASTLFDSEELVS